MVSDVLYLPFYLFVAALGITVNKKLYNNVKNEDHREQGKVIQRLIKTYSIAQCIGWPSLMCCRGVLYMNKSFLKVIPSSLVLYAITLLAFLTILFRVYIAINSLVVAIGRYLFTVFETQALDFGIKRIRQLLIGCSIGVPLFVAILHDATFPLEYHWMSRFMPEYNQSCQNTEKISGSCIGVTAENNHQSPLYTIVNEHFASAVVYGMHLTMIIIVVVIISNIPEGFIYAHTFIRYRR